MIRKVYIHNLVLTLYRHLPAIKFPISMSEILNYTPNCKYMSYQKFAQINKCSIEDVILLCESKSGCTHYDFSKGRYLVLLNNASNDGRKRWTAAHEVGHILCQHHVISMLDRIAENSFVQIHNPEYELEADYFAATLLCPLPLCRYFDIQSAKDIQSIFGLSAEAAAIRYKEYLAWKKCHRKTAWENDIVNIYKQNNYVV